MVHARAPAKTERICLFGEAQEILAAGAQTRLPIFFPVQLHAQALDIEIGLTRKVSDRIVNRPETRLGMDQKIL